MASELFYQLALTLVPNIGDVQARILVQHFGTATAIFNAKEHLLQKIEGIGAIRAQSIKAFADWDKAEAELKFIAQQNIQPIFITDDDYPKRLANCTDAPMLLFYKGTTNLNAAKIISIVGTRTNTEYGKAFTEKLVHDLSPYNIVIVSGLAYGIDSHAHKAAVKNNLPTVGVVGHGLDKIYPPQHAPLAKEMVAAGGGLLTEFFSGTIPDRHNFPLRNRVVAGISDATVVVETLIAGGSMITAKLADGYNRDVFAVPGRTIDVKSAGCNYLIQNNKAVLLNNADTLLEVMGWKEKKKTPPKQRTLFIELTPDERKITDILTQRETVSVNDLCFESGLSNSTIAAVILNLEMQSIITALPGKMYRLA